MVKLVTIATHDDGYFKWLKLSCERFNTKLYVIGWGEKWQGFKWKLIKIFEFLKNEDPNELICFTDAYDTLLLRPLNEIEEYYNYINKLTNKKIIVSSEDIKNPLIRVTSKFIFGTCKGIQLNSGNYIGKAKDLLLIINDIINNYDLRSNDDQVLFTNYCINNPNLFYIDNEKDIFLTIQTSLDDVLNFNVKVDNDQVFYNGSKPFIIHANGNSILDNLIKKLNYNIDTNDTKKIHINHYKIIKNKINHFYNYLNNLYNIEIYLIIIFLIVIIFLYKRKHNLLN